MSRLFSLALCLTLSTFASASQMGTAGTATLTAGAGPNFDTVVYDAPGDGQLWARGRTYKASFGSEGATYIPFLGSTAPRNMPVRMRLAEATLGERELELTSEASWSRDGDTITLDRGVVDVRYHMSPDVVEQTFVLDHLTAEGDLRVLIEMESELVLGEAEQGFRLAGDFGGVDYGTATVFDGAGRSLQLESRIENGAIAIRVPDSFLRNATMPVIVDPLITTYTLSLDDADSRSGDVAFDASNGLFMHTFSYGFSAADYDVWSSFRDIDGNFVPGLSSWVDITAESWESVSVANSNSNDVFLVVATRGPFGSRQIWGRVRHVPGTLQQDQMRLSSQAAVTCIAPSVGGDHDQDSFSRFCVAWSQSYEIGLYHTYYRMVRSDGTLVANPMDLDAVVGTTCAQVSVSKTNGTGSYGERSWNIVWSRRELDQNWDIRGAQVSAHGVLRTPAFTVDSTSATHFTPRASAPLDSPEGGVRDYLVTYMEVNDGGTDIKARLFKADNFQASYDINEIEADVVGNAFLSRDQRWPNIATDGSQFVITYLEEGLDGTNDLYACSLRHQGTELIATEAHTLLADHDVDLWTPAMASAHEGGATGSRRIAIGFMAEVDLNEYDTYGLIYESAPDWGIIGTTICDGVANSTGNSATFRVFGSDEPSDNRLILDVDNLPVFQSGQFIMSQSTQSLPFYNGILCLGAPIVRLNSTISNSWVHGAIGIELDLTSLPQGITFQPGDIWNFQFWYRDAGSANFSNAETVRFQ